MDPHRPSISNPTDGGDIVEGCIRLQAPHELRIRHVHAGESAGAAAGGEARNSHTQSGRAASSLRTSSSVRPRRRQRLRPFDDFAASANARFSPPTRTAETALPYPSGPALSAKRAPTSALQRCVSAGFRVDRRTSAAACHSSRCPMYFAGTCKRVRARCCSHPRVTCFRGYATDSVNRPFDRLRGAGLITIWTSRPSRVRHSSKRCSEMPRNRPFRRAETLGCVSPRISAV